MKSNIYYRILSICLILIFIATTSACNIERNNSRTESSQSAISNSSGETTTDSPNNSLMHPSIIPLYNGEKLFPKSKALDFDWTSEDVKKFLENKDFSTDDANTNTNEVLNLYWGGEDGHDWQIAFYDRSDKKGRGGQVFNIFIKDPNYSTPEGLRIGDTIGKMKELYGDNYMIEYQGSTWTWTVYYYSNGLCIGTVNEADMDSNTITYISFVRPESIPSNVIQH